MHRLSQPVRVASLVCIALLLLARNAPARDVGIAIADFDVTFFDTEQYAPIITLPFPPVLNPVYLTDSVVTADGRFAYVGHKSVCCSATHAGDVVVYDLTLDPPGLAAGTNIIEVATNTQDIALSTDDRFLAIGGGFSFLGEKYPITVIDLTTRTVADTIAVPVLEHWGVAFGPDGSLLFCSLQGIGRLIVDANGQITDTGVLFNAQPPATGFGGGGVRNVEIAPDGKTAVALFRGRDIGSVATPGTLVTFSIPGMQEISRAFVDGDLLAWAQFSSDGTRLFAASSHSLSKQPRGNLFAFDFDSSTGVIGARLWKSPSIPLDQAVIGFGRDLVALDSSGKRIFSGYKGRMIVHDATEGTVLAGFSLQNGAGNNRSTAVRR